MKKLIILTAIAVSSLSLSLSAQDNVTDFRSRFMLGVKGGVNLSNVYDSEGEQFVADSKWGGVGGIFLSIPIGRYLGIQPEVLFSQKGFKATGVILGSPYSITRTSNYIDMPLFFALKPLEFITLLAGPQISYLLNQDDRFKNAGTTIAQETEFVNENVRKNTLCFVAGADITLKHLVLGARMGWDLQTNNGDGSSRTPRYKNVWYQATIGYRFYSHRNG